MKKMGLLILSFWFLLVIRPMTVEAEEMKGKGIQLSVEDVLNADFFIIDDEEIPHIEIFIKEKLVSDYHREMKSFEKTSYSIYADTKEEIYKWCEEFNDVKKTYGAKGSGSYTDHEFFCAYALCITSTLNYTTMVSSNIVYGKVNSVYVECSTNSGFVIDDLSVYYGECGFTMNRDFVSYYSSAVISNYSTTSFPTSWPYIYWDASVGSSTGASVTATIHRGTSTPKQYTFYNNVIG